MEMSDKEEMKLENQLCFPLYAAARSVTALYTPYLKPLGLTYTQYIVFLVLWEKDGIPVGELGKRLMLDSGTLSPLLKKMRQAGYIEKRQSAEDERSFLITLTDKGIKTAENLYERHTILTDLLVSLGVDRETAAVDACKIEHVISAESFEAIKNYINQKNSAD
jgi:DNA-binding MarR family transcriptional regulator